MKPLQLAWPFTPQPVIGELLSSYLARIAHAHGMKPYSFYAFHFPGVPIWDRDIDLGIKSGLLEKISACSGQSLAALQAMTLQAWLIQLTPNPRAMQPSGISPWINALGIFHRTRTRFGVQYCPACLHKMPAFLKIWRLAFVTVCPIHRTTLLDSCMHCSTPVAFHRAERFMASCHACGRPLALSSIDVDDHTIPKRLALQKTLLHILNGGVLFIEGVPVSAHRFFKTATLLLQSIKNKIRTHSCSLRLPADLRSCPTGQIELARTDARARQCLLLWHCMKDWPLRFLHTFNAPHIAHGLNNQPADPLLLISIVLGQTRSRQKNRQIAKTSPVRKQLRQLQRNKHFGWRTRRAECLLKAAK